MGRRQRDGGSVDSDEKVREELGVGEITQPSAPSVDVAETTHSPAPVVASKREKVRISATFKTRTLEGDRITHKFTGTGDDVKRALADVKGSDEDITDDYGKPFPRGINMLVNAKVEKGDYEFSRALAPHVAQSIFDEHRVELVEKLFGLKKA